MIDTVTVNNEWIAHGCIMPLNILSSPLLKFDIVNNSMLELSLFDNYSVGE